MGQAAPASQQGQRWGPLLLLLCSAVCALRALIANMTSARLEEPTGMQGPEWSAELFSQNNLCSGGWEEVCTPRPPPPVAPPT